MQVCLSVKLSINSQPTGLNCGALKWEVIYQFHEYFYGNTFTVYPNKIPLIYVLTSAQLESAGHCCQPHILQFCH